MVNVYILEQMSVFNKEPRYDIDKNMTIINTLITHAFRTVTNNVIVH